MAKKQAQHASDPDEGGLGTAPERVEALARGLAIVKCFGRGREKLTLSEIAELTSISRASARRLLFTLLDLGYVVQHGRDFSLSSRVLELGYSYLVSMPWWEIATPHMRRISDALNETCVASVLQDHEVVMVARASGSHFTAINMPMGTRLPAHATAMGRVLIAALPDEARQAYLKSVTLKTLTEHTIIDAADLASRIEDARVSGYAMVNEELELGLRTIAVPIHASDGTAIAGLAVSVYAPRVSAEKLKKDALSLLQRAAEEISGLLPRPGSIDQRRPPLR